jgi:hypothetical protein
MTNLNANTQLNIKIFQKTGVRPHQQAPEYNYVNLVMANSTPIFRGVAVIDPTPCSSAILSRDKP